MIKHPDNCFWCGTCHCGSCKDHKQCVYKENRPRKVKNEYKKIKLLQNECVKTISQLDKQ